MRDGKPYGSSSLPRGTFSAEDLGQERGGACETPRGDRRKLRGPGGHGRPSVDRRQPERMELHREQPTCGGPGGRWTRPYTTRHTKGDSSEHPSGKHPSQNAHTLAARPNSVLHFRQKNTKRSQVPRGEDVPFVGPARRTRRALSESDEVDCRARNLVGVTRVLS